MASTESPRPSGAVSSANARGISLAGLVLFAVYLSILLGALFPLKVLDPLWELRVGTSLINAAPFPLLGLALLHLASSIDPLDQLLISRRRTAAALSVLAALGFLLLVPLMSFGAIQQQRLQGSSQSAQIAAADGRIQALRQAIAAATSSDDLSSRLVALKGPALNAVDRSQPLPVLKAQVGALLDQVAGQLARQRQLAPPPNAWLLLPDLLRNGFACLALAVGFAGLARRRQVSVSLLEELQRWWQNSWRRPMVARPRRWSYWSDSWLRWWQHYSGRWWR
jgi:hypothetical protein